MAVFTASELIDVAVGIERNGVAYYGSLSEIAGDSSLKKTYADLADMERHHVELFEKMRSAVSDEGAGAPEIEEAEYEAYLNALIDSSVFTDDKVARELAQKAAGPAEALQLALRAEKDSILFYTEMRELVPQRDREAIDNIIKEERKHVRELSELKQRYM
ncbi:MAG: ferritin family protein [Dehalococcoidia bacterium]|nr:ferritin family protein [Dehalococcoidia bacterium]